jgi:hypothetical protein
MLKNFIYSMSPLRYYLGNVVKYEIQLPTNSSTFLEGSYQNFLC